MAVPDDAEHKVNIHGQPELPHRLVFQQFLTRTAKKAQWRVGVLGARRQDPHHHIVRHQRVVVQEVEPVDGIGCKDDAEQLRVDREEGKQHVEALEFAPVKQTRTVWSSLDGLTARGREAATSQIGLVLLGWERKGEAERQACAGHQRRRRAHVVEDAGCGSMVVLQ